MDSDTRREAEIEAARALFSEPQHAIKPWAFTAYIMHRNGGDPNALCGGTITTDEMHSAIDAIQKLVNERLTGQGANNGNGQVRT